jgi:hypothetical protein
MARSAIANLSQTADRGRSRRYRGYWNSVRTRQNGGLGDGEDELINIFSLKTLRWDPEQELIHELVVMVKSQYDLHVIDAAMTRAADGSFETGDVLVFFNPFLELFH